MLYLNAWTLGLFIGSMGFSRKIKDKNPKIPINILSRSKTQMTSKSLLGQESLERFSHSIFKA